jgi:hypothetical protein
MTLCDARGPISSRQVASSSAARSCGLWDTEFDQGNQGSLAFLPERRTMVIQIWHHVVRNWGLPNGAFTAVSLPQSSRSRDCQCKTPLDPDVADEAPTTSVLTGYDEEHLVTYLRLLDAEADGADGKEVADRAAPRSLIGRPRAWATHLAGACWMTEQGYRHLLRGGAPH